MRAAGTPRDANAPVSGGAKLAPLSSGQSPMSASSPWIRIVSRDNGVGLSRDMAIMADALHAYGHVDSVGFGSGGAGKALLQARLAMEGRWRGPADVQVFSERVYPRCLPLARHNLLVPNPEWFLDKWRPLLPAFERVLCKTRHAERLFAGLGCRTDYIGFTSEDRLQAQVPRRPAFFHLAGRSRAKGTRVLLDTWLGHPEWPMLTVVQHPRMAEVPVRAANIDHRIAYLDDAELRTLQNAHLFHICPSEAEGYGHYLMEAMSVGAIVLTTRAEPMTELVPPGLGIHIPVQRVREEGMVPRHYVAPVGIERAVEAALGMDEARRADCSNGARRHFLEARGQFLARFQAVVDEVVQSAVVTGNRAA